jgi:hypothetical protein
MTTTTVFGDTADDTITSFDNTYSVARDHGGSDEGVNAATTELVFGQNFSSPTYYCIEAFVAFDTSPIPDTDVVSAAVLSLWGFNDNDASDLMTGVARVFDWSTAVDLTDFRTASQLSALTQVASAAAGVFASGAYFAFTSTGSMPAAINVTGTTRFVLHSNRHAAGTTPTIEEYWQTVASDVAGTTNDPKLVVTHAAAAGGQPTAKRYGGVQFATYSPGNLVRRW